MKLSRSSGVKVHFCSFKGKFAMKAAEFSAIELDLGLSTPAYADALGIDVRRVRAFEAGTSEVPQVVALAAWALFMQPRIGRVLAILT